MNQQTGQTTRRKRRKSTKRVATRDLVRIGQRWQRKSRKRIKPPPVVIHQIYRHERYVLAHEGKTWRREPGVPLERITFADLTAKYKLIKEESK